MAGYLTTPIEWHDLRVHPDDLPGEGEPIIVTVETFTDRLTWLDVFMKEESAGEPHFYTRTINEYGQLEDTAVWYPIVAWAYPPPPYNFF